MKGSFLVDYNHSFANEISHCAYRRECGESNAVSRRLLKDETQRVLIEDLTDRQREMLTLYYLGGVNIPQLALRYRLNRSTVSRHISAAKRRIQKRVLKTLDKTVRK